MCRSVVMMENPGFVFPVVSSFSLLDLEMRVFCAIEDDGVFYRRLCLLLSGSY